MSDGFCISGECRNPLSPRARLNICVTCQRRASQARYDQKPEVKVARAERLATGAPNGRTPPGLNDKGYAAYREDLWEFLSSLKREPCMDCGVLYPPCVMDWDHRPGEIKRFALSKATSRSRTAILAEVAKCDLVCANCHRIRTARRSGLLLC